MKNYNIIDAKENLERLIRLKFPLSIYSINNLSILSEKTTLSVQTLRRFFGQIDRDKNLSKSSLSLLCQYVGYKDWDSYLNQFNSEKNLSLEDKYAIDNMSIFFKNGEKYNINYHQSTLTVDTLNEYAKLIYKNRNTLEYFYSLYHNNKWACSYILAWLPNYNFVAQDWYIKMCEDFIHHKPSILVRLTLCNFVCFGSFLSKDYQNFEKKLTLLKYYYKKYQKEYVYMPFQEMRYHSILLIDAKRNNNNGEFKKILNDYVETLDNVGLSKANKQEILVFFCNTLLWLGAYQISYSLLKNNLDILSEHRKDESAPVHFHGLNMRFVKVTLLLTWLKAEKPALKIIELNDINQTSHDSFLYDSYLEVMLLAYRIKKERNTSNIEFLKTELESHIKKTNLNVAWSLMNF